MHASTNYFISLYMSTYFLMLITLERILLLNKLNSLRTTNFHATLLLILQTKPTYFK